VNDATERRFPAMTIAFLWLCLWLGGCSGSASPPLIETEIEYADIVEEVRGLTEEPLKRFDSGTSLSEGERQRLRRAIRLIQGLINYKPEHFANYFLMGKVLQSLGDDSGAIQRFQACVALIEPKTEVEEFKRTRAEAHYLSANSLQRIGGYEQAESEAQAALGYYPDNPNFLAAAAAAKIQLGMSKLPEAKKLLEKALSVDPLHGRSRQLLRLYEAANSHPAP
jgi:tetratricopeptide (TPR) repeat protein